jgi:hypothetical protein
MPDRVVLQRPDTGQAVRHRVDRAPEATDAGAYRSVPDAGRVIAEREPHIIGVQRGELIEPHTVGDAIELVDPAGVAGDVGRIRRWQRLSPLFLDRAAHGTSVEATAPM